MVEVSRRRLIGGLLGLVAAPAIVRVASLMPVSLGFALDEDAFLSDLIVTAQATSSHLLTINQITRDAVRMFENSNLFIEALDMQYASQFAMDRMKIGTHLRIRLPKDGWSNG